MNVPSCIPSPRTLTCWESRSAPFSIQTEVQDHDRDPRSPQSPDPRAGQEPFAMACEKQSVAGSVSQRACVFCGSRVVLYPIADARAPGPRPDRLRGLHLGHPRLALLRAGAPPPELLHRPARDGRDLRRREEAQPGPARTDRPLPAQGGLRLLHVHRRPDRRRRGGGLPRRAAETGIPVLPVQSEGFKGTKKDGYRAACDALAQLVGTGQHRAASRRSASTSSAISTWPARPG